MNSSQSAPALIELSAPVLKGKPRDLRLRRTPGPGHYAATDPYLVTQWKPKRCSFGTAARDGRGAAAQRIPPPVQYTPKPESKVTKMGAGVLRTAGLYVTRPHALQGFDKAVQVAGPPQFSTPSFQYMQLPDGPGPAAYRNTKRAASWRSPKCLFARAERSFCTDPV